MALDPALERPHLSVDPTFSDAVTCTFADPHAGVQGSVRIGLADGAASGLTLVFVDGVPALTEAEGGIPVDGRPESYAQLQAAGIDHAIVTPHTRWTVAVASDAGALELAFVAEGPPLVLDAEHEAAKWGGMEGYEQPCRVTGTVTLTPPDGAPRRIVIDGVGQRGHQWGTPDWSRLTLSRTITGWFPDGPAFHISTLRPAGARSHADEVAWAGVSRAPLPPANPDGAEDPGAAPQPLGDPLAVETPEPRISTTTDADGHHTHATVELWESDEGPVWTATGEAISGTTLELGRLRLDMAFFRWRMQGLEGVGRYDVLRKAPEEGPLIPDPGPED